MGMLIVGSRADIEMVDKMVENHVEYSRLVSIPRESAAEIVTQLGMECKSNASAFTLCAIFQRILVENKLEALRALLNPWALYEPAGKNTAYTAVWMSPPQLSSYNSVTDYVNSLVSKYSGI